MVNWYAAGLAVAILYIIPKRLIVRKIINYYKYKSLEVPPKLVIVILDNIGINYEKARSYAKKGAKIIIGSFDQNKGETAKKELIQSTKNKNILAMSINRNDKHSIKVFAESIMKSETSVDVLINNKGLELADLDINFKKQELARERFENHCFNFLGGGICLPEDL